MPVGIDIDLQILDVEREIFQLEKYEKSSSSAKLTLDDSIHRIGHNPRVRVDLLFHKKGRKGVRKRIFVNYGVTITSKLMSFLKRIFGFHGNSSVVSLFPFSIPEARERKKKLARSNFCIGLVVPFSLSSWKVG